MNTSEFHYVVYIRTTPEALWNALTNPEFTSQYWIDGIESDWQQGSIWQRRGGDDNTRVTICGEVLDCEPLHRLTMTWADPDDTSDSAQHSRVSFVIEALGDMVRLSLAHRNLKPGSVIATKISVGWPRVLSSLKSLLETGSALDTWAGY